MHDVEAVDATLWRQEGRWWLFVNLASTPGGSTWDDLHLFHRDDLFGGPWIPHPGNPIVADVMRARPAGNLFQENGRLYRPSQNCGPAYGHGLNINEVTRLDEFHYEEKPFLFIEPDPTQGLLGIHTLNYAHGLTMADAKRHKFRHIL